jgi:hypothetical protein
MNLKLISIFIATTASVFATDATSWTTLSESKKVNIELASGEFLELNIPVIKLIPKHGTKLELQDIETVKTIEQELTHYISLPQSEQLQPFHQDKLKKTTEKLTGFLNDLKLRIDPAEVKKN